jgi:hypothetical protein
MLGQKIQMKCLSQFIDGWKERRCNSLLPKYRTVVGFGVEFSFPQNTENEENATKCSQIWFTIQDPISFVKILRSR